MKVYLDDERQEPRGWVRTNTSTDTIELLLTDKVTELSLDHDLGDDAQYGTGYDVLKWMEFMVFTEKWMTPEVIKIHTANPAGRVNMEAALNQIRKLEDKNLKDSFK